MSTRYRVHCATYNGHLGRGHTLSYTPSDLAAWLGPALAPSTASGEEGADEDLAPPEFVAVGFQELMPLHLALVGLTSPTLDLHEQQLLQAIEAAYASSSSTSEKPAPASAPAYTLLARHSLGGIALLVFALQPVAKRVTHVALATAGCGVGGLMGNKGAVGVRVTLREEEEEVEVEKGEEGARESTWTFVNAHLAAHGSEKHVKRRNWDGGEIVRRLVFEEEKGGEVRMFDTGHLFFFGDLNYRLTPSAYSDLPALSSQLSTLTSSSCTSSTFSTAHSSLFAHDQLTCEFRAGRTLHHLLEGVPSFAPTYKFRLGSRDQYVDVKKRVGWTDRVLYASAAGGEAKVESYRSVMDFTRSDHKPVSALISLPRSLSSHRLPHPNPFPLDPLWRLKRLLGLLLDRSVGGVWCLVVLAGLGRGERLGLVNLALAVLALYFRRSFWQ
ncbi:hypothetical protein JCM8097_005890 [Rhodosporidiobolus ruineniae]